MARTLVVCCDGTWSTPVDDTNVRRFHDALATSPTQQPQYFSGVGTRGNPLSRLVDGVTGAGLPETIRAAYRWIADVWAPGDRLVLVGFSRGAFTVRSLVGMLTRCGLARFPAGASEAERDATVDHVYREGYRRRRAAPGVDTWPGFGPDDVAPIDFLGVWDTVGALGVPRNFGLLSSLVGSARYAFHDTGLDDDVRHARQALALDEQRGAYVPAVWAAPVEGRHLSVVQQWFPGGHGDVGGGNPSHGLSDGALRWLAAEAAATVGLEWDVDLADPAVAPGDPLAPDDAAVTGLDRYLAPRPRTVPRVVEGAPDVHPSAVERRARRVPPYRPGVVPGDGAPGAATGTVAAGEPWSETGLFLTPGRWRVALVPADATWTARGAAVGVTGASRSPLRWPWRDVPAWTLGTLLGGVRAAIRAVTSPSAQVAGAPRVAGARWMALVLAVANDVLHPDGSRTEGTTVPIGEDGTVELDVPRPGYLFGFANEAWTASGRLDGTVTLSVWRLTGSSGSSPSS